jgi:hypothetical protein
LKFEIFFLFSFSFLYNLPPKSNSKIQIGEGMFQFAYANGLYSTRSNQCGCAAIGGGPINTSSQGCKCAFPVAGEPPKKRDLEDMYAKFLTARAVEAKKPAPPASASKKSASPAAAPKTSSSSSNNSNNNKNAGTVSK